MTELNSTHRCDSCSAQAFHVFESDNTGNDLMLCNHHKNRYEDALVLQGFRSVVDQSDRINAKPSVSASV